MTKHGKLIVWALAFALVRSPRRRKAAGAAANWGRHSAPASRSALRRSARHRPGPDRQQHDVRHRAQPGRGRSHEHAVHSRHGVHRVARAVRLRDRVPPLRQGLRTRAHSVPPAAQGGCALRPRQPGAARPSAAYGETPGGNRIGTLTPQRWPDTNHVPARRLRTRSGPRSRWRGFSRHAHWRAGSYQQPACRRCVFACANPRACRDAGLRASRRATAPAV